MTLAHQISRNAQAEHPLPDTNNKVIAALAVALDSAMRVAGH